MLEKNNASNYGALILLSTNNEDFLKQPLAFQTVHPGDAKFGFHLGSDCKTRQELVSGLHTEIFCPGCHPAQIFENDCKDSSCFKRLTSNTYLRFFGRLTRTSTDGEWAVEEAEARLTNYPK